MCKNLEKKDRNRACLDHCHRSHTCIMLTFIQLIAQCKPTTYSFTNKILIDNKYDSQSFSC